MGMKKGTAISKWINSDKLPRDVNGHIDWVHSVGEEIEFQYGSLNSSLRILKYEHNKSRVLIYISGYTGLDGKTISVDALRDCRLSSILKSPVAKTNPELIKYFVNKADAYKYYPHSGKKVEVMCPFCGAIKRQQVGKLTDYGFSCPVCSDGLSYPNKFMYNILTQLGVSFKNEISRASDGFEWIVDGCRYDFYFELLGKKYFLEMDGAFHYKNIFSNKYNQRQIDQLKDSRAKEHNITTIRINCNYPSLANRFQFIKEQILSSELCDVFEMSSIDWNVANKYAINSIVVEVATLWSKGVKSTKEIANNMSISTSTVVAYLKIGNEIGLCKYTSDIAEKNRRDLTAKAVSKPLVLFQDGVQIGVFQSASELERQSERLYGKRIMKGHAAEVCRGDRKQTCGFTMKYITWQEYGQIVQEFN